MGIVTYLNLVSEAGGSFHTVRAIMMQFCELSPRGGEWPHWQFLACESCSPVKGFFIVKGKKLGYNWVEQ